MIRVEGDAVFVSVVPTNYSLRVLESVTRLTIAKGQPGAQGPAGAQGATGPTGPQGPAGHSGTILNTTVDIQLTSDLDDVEVTNFGASGAVVVTAPPIASLPVGWKCSAFVLQDAQPLTLRVNEQLTSWLLTPGLSSAFASAKGSHITFRYLGHSLWGITEFVGDWQYGA